VLATGLSVSWMRKSPVAMAMVIANWAIELPGDSSIQKRMATKTAQAPDDASPTIGPLTSRD